MHDAAALSDIRLGARGWSRLLASRRCEGVNRRSAVEKCCTEFNALATGLPRHSVVGAELDGISLPHSVWCARAEVFVVCDRGVDHKRIAVVVNMQLPT
ncbi:hypothetical protein D3C73_840860 [compost metagenome]